MIVFVDHYPSCVIEDTKSDILIMSVDHYPSCACFHILHAIIG